MRKIPVAIAAIMVIAACSQPARFSSDTPEEPKTSTQATTAETTGDFIQPLKPGETPPQFVVFSWDGGGNPALQQRFRNIMKKYDGHMTIFLTGIYFVPKEKRTLYKPPGRKPGQSAIAFARSEESARKIIQSTVDAYEDGHEIGTHFNGHFCGATGVDTWSPEMWRSEIDQSVSFVKDFKQHTGFNDMADLPFEYTEELQGGRTPCLEGQANMLPVANELGWSYDSSGTGNRVWPRKFADYDMWDMPLQMMPWHDGSQVLSMDYNFMVKQSGFQSNPDASQHPTYRKEMAEALLAGINQSANSNRAPIIIGNHFNDWNGGAYMDGVEDVMHEIGPREDIKMVSFEELVAWLEVQDPEVIKKLQDLNVDEEPPGGWSEYLWDGRTS